MEEYVAFENRRIRDDEICDLKTLKLVRRPEKETEKKRRHLWKQRDIAARSEMTWMAANIFLFPQT